MLMFGQLVHYRSGGPQDKVQLRSLGKGNWTKLLIVNNGNKAVVYENGQKVQVVK